MSDERRGELALGGTGDAEPGEADFGEAPAVHGAHETSNLRKSNLTPNFMGLEAVLS